MRGEGFSVLLIGEEMSAVLAVLAEEMGRRSVRRKFHGI
jgi:hypothetical protein